MKKVILFATVALLSTGAFAQKYEDIKGMLAVGQLDKAKQMYEKNSKNEKFFTKSEGYLVKACLLANEAVGDTTRSEASAQIAQESYEAFQKYKEMDPSLKELEDPVYKNTPYWIYASYYNTATPAITSQDDSEISKGYERLKKAVELSEFIIDNKLSANLPGPFDTSLVFYTGYMAERSKDEAGVVKYYTKLADAKINSSEDHKRIYQQLIQYYANKNDNQNFEKYNEIGKSLFPNESYFTHTILDFAMSGGDFNERVANLEKHVNSNPEDYKANLALAEIIYDTLDSRKIGAVPPANAEELEKKMLAALNKAGSLKPDETQPFLLLGDHYLIKSEKLRDEMVTAETEVTKKGSKATAADKQKFADVRAAYNSVYDLARDNYEKAAVIFSKISELDAQQKRTYRLIAGNLTEYYSYKIEDSKSTADRDKYAALEKKWDTLFSKLR